MSRVAVKKFMGKYATMEKILAKWERHLNTFYRNSIDNNTPAGRRWYAQAKKYKNALNSISRQIENNNNNLRNRLSLQADPNGNNNKYLRRPRIPLKMYPGNIKNVRRDLAGNTIIRYARAASIRRGLQGVTAVRKTFPNNIARYILTLR
jgi:uncharacterized protein YukE